MKKISLAGLCSSRKRRLATVVAAGALTFAISTPAFALVTGPSGPAKPYPGTDWMPPDIRGVQLVGADAKKAGLSRGGDLNTYGFYDGSGRRGVCVDAAKIAANAQSNATTVHNPVANALLALYVTPGNRDDTSNATAAYAFGAKLQVNSRPDLVESEARIMAKYPGAVGTVAQYALAHGSEYVAGADGFQGPYSIEVKLVGDAARNNAVGQIDRDHFGLMSAKHWRWPGGNVQLTLSGTSEAVWDVTGNRTISFTTDGQGRIPANVNVGWHALKTGTTQVAAATVGNQVPDVAYDLFASSVSAYQRTASARLAPAAGTDTAVIQSTVASVDVSTGLQTQVVMPGQDMTDVIRGQIKGAPGKTAYTGTLTAYGPFEKQPAQSKEVPKSAPVIGKVDYAGTTDAAGKYELNKTIKAPASGKTGYVVFVAETRAKVGNATLSDHDDFGLVAETALMVYPTVVTKISAQRAMSGDKVWDTATVTGIYPKAPDGTPITYTLTGQAHGARKTASTKPEDWTNQPKAALVSPVTVTKDGDYKVGEFTVAESGYYNFSEELVITYKGKKIGLVEHKAGNTVQTTFVQTPKLRTEVTKTQIGKGEKAADKVIISDFDGRKGKVHSVAYGYLPVPASGVCDDIGKDRWAAAKKDGSAKAIGTFDMDVAGSGTFTTKEFVGAVEGCVSWEQELTSPDYPGKVFRSELGEKGESTQVMATPPPPNGEKPMLAIPTAFGGGFIPPAGAAGILAGMVMLGTGIMARVMARRSQTALAS